MSPQSRVTDAAQKQVLKRLQRSATARRKLEERRSWEMQQTALFIRQGLGRGIPMQTLAAAAGLSRQGAYDLLKKDQK